MGVQLNSGGTCFSSGRQQHSMAEQAVREQKQSRQTHTQLTQEQALERKQVAVLAVERVRRTPAGDECHKYNQSKA